MYTAYTTVRKSYLYTVYLYLLTKLKDLNQPDPWGGGLRPTTPPNSINNTNQSL